MVNNKSLLQFKKANCKNCYKCVRNCPVKAIRIQNQQATIIESQCILCEKCTLLCPQNAKVELNQVPEIQSKMRAGMKFAASVHPAYLAQYPGIDFSVIRDALKAIGFSDAYEGAEAGALMKRRYEMLLEKKAGEGQENMPVISSQCPVVVLLILRKYPELIPYLAPVPSMMETHAAMIKADDPDVAVVYISPCISAMTEMNEAGNQVSYVITFAELEEWMKQRYINLKAYRENEALSKEKPTEQADAKLSRIQAVGGGLSQSMQPAADYHYININGIVNCMGVLNELKENPRGKCFLDLNACINGCVGGPSFRKPPIHLLEAIQSVANAAKRYPEKMEYDMDFSCEKYEEILPLYNRTFPIGSLSVNENVNEGEIRAILEKMGKQSEKDELNCGACGYNTCREKAIAISQGKAEVSMCVPFMRARQESYSNKIINAMPGLLITVDYDLNVIHMNKAAQDMFDICRKKNIIGNQVSEIMDDYSLVNMIANDKYLTQDQVILPDGVTCLDRVMTNDPKNRLILCVMKDITKEIEKKKSLARSQNAAAEMADRLMEEQLRMVHKIAGLLGETAADTKVAIERLKDTIMQESDRL